jgi:hypothetical protein
VRLFIFENALRTHLLHYSKSDPERNDETKEEQQQPERHTGDHKEQYNTENAHFDKRLMVYGGKNSK